MSKALADSVAAQILNKAKQRYPDKACSVGSISVVEPAIVAWYGTGVRIRVTDEHGYTRTGIVRATGGWSPALLLMHRNSDRGSSDVLGASDRLVAVQHNGRDYVDV